VPVVRTRTRDKNGRKRYYESDSEDDTALAQYRECREKNNEASRRSRMNKKAKESEMAVKAIKLERDNKILKMKVEELEKLVTSMRTALLRSALKKEI
jgi:seryl-tRNA synthetase